MDFEKFKTEYCQKGTSKCGLVYGTLGALLAIAFLFLGVLKTLFVAALFALGYFIGSREDSASKVRKTLHKIIDSKDQK